MSLSIIIPAYNAAETLEATIRSAIGMRSSAVEVIVVDDGSMDETRSICYAFVALSMKISHSMPSMHESSLI